MASKKIEKKKQTYPEFLRQIGRWQDGIVPVGFRFPKELDTHSLHFRVMDAKVGHVLFDCVKERAVVCVPKENADKVREIAAGLGGEEFSVTLML